MSQIKPVEGSNFKLERAQELLHLVAQAHEQYTKAKENPQWEWEKELCSLFVGKREYKILANLGFAQYFFFKRRRVPFGFILQRGTSVFVVFRGTSNPAEWISNFKAVQEPFLNMTGHEPELNEDFFWNDGLSFATDKDEFLNHGHLGEVHRGFHQTYMRRDRGGLLNFQPDDDRSSMKETVEKTLNAAALLDSPVSEVFVTGHSLGGAIATLAALHIRKTTPFRLPILYTFASPRVGDPQFAQHFEPLECYRIANSEDLVTTIPFANKLLTLEESANGVHSRWRHQLSDMDYQHIGEPIYFTTQNRSVAANHIISTYQAALSTLKTLSHSL